MRLEILDAVSDPEPRPGRVNEDLHGSAADAVWVLDGATGIADQRVVPGPSDARWLAEVIAGALGRALAEPLTSADLLHRVAAAASAAFMRDALRRDAPATDRPSACLALLRLAGPGLELANIGDCRILHRHARGAVSCFGSSKLPALDEAVRQQAIRLQGEGVRHDEIWPLLLPLIRRNRGAMNTPEGYWVVDVTGRWLPHVETTSRAAAAGDALLLVTDGFWRLVDTYQRYDADALLSRASSRGLAALIGELRAVEAADEECRRYPRLKAQDDATAVLARITG